MAWCRLDWVGITVVGVAIAGLIQFRLSYVEPRVWDMRCEVSAPLLVCGPRAALLWLQQYDLWGSAGLVLGILAFMWGNRMACVSAVVVGIAGVINYNASWGMLGAALGFWGWIRRPGGREGN
jgi:hypothetical protein